MSRSDPGEHLWIVGPGRVGLALGELLLDSGVAGSLTFSGRRLHPPDHLLFRDFGGAVRYQSILGVPEPAPSAVLIAVPDAAIAEVAARLGQESLIPNTPVLHLSGALGLEVLAPLARAGCSVGSLHPLAAMPAHGGGAERLRGAWFGVEADGEAFEFARWIVRAAEGHLLPVRSGGKALYHAAAMFASNYIVALLAVAESLMGRAGVPAADARAALSGLADGAVRNVAVAGPVPALTGPVARGDAETVHLHLARLFPGERDLYCLLARQALRLAREQGIAPDRAERIKCVLEEFA